MSIKDELGGRRDPVSETVQESSAPGEELTSPSVPSPKLKERFRLYLKARLEPKDISHTVIAVMAGALLIALTNAIAIAALVPWPSGGVRVRALHHAFDILQTLGLGALWAAFLGLGARFIPLQRSVLALLYTLVSMLIMYTALSIDLRRQAFVVLGGRFEHPLFEIYIFLTGLALPAAHAIGTFFSAFKWLRLIPIGASLAGIVTNHAVLRDDYPGVHGAVTLVTLTLFGATVAPYVHDRLESRFSSRFRAIAMALGALMTGLSIGVAPSNTVRLELFREPGSVAAWALARSVWSMPAVPDVSTPLSSADSSWFSDRSALPSINPTEPPLVKQFPVVVFITIDAFRADLLENPAYERLMPNLTQMKRAGAYFTRATSPGSQTSVSLTTTFSGRYFSQLFWKLYGKANSRFDYAAEDKTPRFPELLRQAAVKTKSVCSLNFLSGDYGVIRGFETEQMVAHGRTHAAAKPVVDALLDQLNRVGSDESAFLFTHLTEPHAPYDRGNPETIKTIAGTEKISEFHRYVAEAAVADAELGRVVRTLFQRFPLRGVLIVSSDHGEAFGEHDTFNHTKTLYEELVRVPLLIRGPAVVARRIEQHVGLIDIGPTVLDLFRQPVPPSFMGQSLVPLLQGKDPVLDRPILAEGRLRRALYRGNLKIIEDLRRKVIEAYDLERDPLELHNIVDEESARIAPHLSLLHTFFQVHEARAPGYKVPFKP